MNDNVKKSSLEEAKISFEEIQKFAQEEAAKSLNEKVSETLKQLFEEKLNEDTTINIDGSGNVEISTSGEVVNMDKTGEESGEDMGLSPAEEIGGEDSEEFVVSDEEDAISLDNTMDEIIQNENMEEMNNITMEADATAPAPTPAPEAAPAPTADAAAAPAATPVEEAPAMPDLLAKLDTLINIMMQQQGAPAETPAGAEAGTEQEFNVIDDEAAGAPAPGAPAPDAGGAPALAPMEEIEIEDFESDKDSAFIDEMEGQMLEIVDEDEMPEAGCSVDETRSLGFTSKRTGDKNLKMDTMEKNKGHHAPVTSLKESDKDKAQYESKIDELIKENKGLKNTVKNLQGERKEFEEAFVDLRTQFNEMQLFNGKLALVNKVLMNGGLTQDEKVKVCEQFDSVQTYEEASKLFKTIIKENNIKVVDGKEKLKSASTNTAKPKSTTETLYESDEAKRLKKLAGLGKTEEED